jgi:hypothetical protein
MAWHWTTAGIAAALAFCALPLLGHAQNVLDGGVVPTRSTWSGVFTEAQAKRGENDFVQFHCGYCHHPDMSGDVSEGVSPLRGEHFMVNWDAQPLSDFVRRIHLNPSDQSTDMDIATATDITAYILAANNLPYGKTELPADHAAQAMIRWDQVDPDKK